jgi:imidazolonepropionase
VIDLLIQPCGQLLTLAGPRSPRRGAQMQDIGLVEHGALGINLATGVIEYAGPAKDLEGSLVAESCPTIDAGRCVVLPGFVDSHTHLVYSGSRADEFYARAGGASYQQIAQAGGGIARTVEATRATSPAELERLARKRLHKLYDSGTTTVEAKSGYGLSREHELMALEVLQRLVNSEPGLVLSTCLAAHAVPEEFAGRRTEYVEVACALLRETAELGLADFYDVFIDALAFTQREAEQLVDSARGTLLGLRVHADEFSDDGSAQWAAVNGALSADHLCAVSEAGIKALAASDTIATLLPATMFYTGSERYAPARALIDAGCAVALATDHNPGSSLVYGMPFVLTLAALKMRMTPEECITAATVNGAHALGVASLVGTLEPGKRADFTILDLPDYRELPCQLGANFVRDVYIRGRAVKSMGYLALRD